MTNPTETARALLHRHGVPEDIVDGVLAVHAQELAAVQRRDAAVWGLDTAAGEHRAGAADLIDPTRTPAVPVPSVDRAALLVAQQVTWAVHEQRPDPARSMEYREGWEAALDAAISAARNVLPAPADRAAENARLRAELEDSRAIALSRCRTLDKHEATIERLRADRAAAPGCICGHPEERHFEDVCQTCGCGDYLEPRDAAEVIARWRQAALTARADRAAVLLEAAEQADAEANRLYDDMGQKAAAGARAVADRLRRMAAEAQPATPDTESEAHPAEHRWAAELYDPAADEWVPGTRYLVRDRALAALEHGRRIGPTWKDGTPTQRRLVRETKTYTVEAEPAAPGAAATPETEA